MTTSRNILAAVLVLCLSPLVFALQADELLLIVNSNSPEGRELAEYYVKARGVPGGRIVEIAMPVQDAMSFEQYNDQVVPAVRKFITDNQLKDKVKCLVTFYGVPIRISNQAPTTQEAVDANKLVERQKKIMEQIEPAVKTAEALALEVKPDFKPNADNKRLDQLTARYDAALNTISQAMPRQPLEKRSAIMQKLVPIFEQLTGPVGVVQRIGPMQLTDPAITEEGRKDWTGKMDLAKATLKRVDDLAKQFDKPENRQALYQIAEKQLGLIGQGQIMQQEIDLLRHRESGSSLDSELSLLWWETAKYPRVRWLPNPLCYAIKATGPNIPPPAIMVTRLDAPEPAIVKRMIDTSIQVEKDGLKGKAVIDSRGQSPGTAARPNAYGVFDERLRILAKYLKEHTKLEVVHDDKGELIPANSQENIALYCGWYSLENYVCPGKFNAGAVGYHIASGEMGSLHNPKKQWVGNLLKDGVVATEGPVQEPYLFAFNLPEEFFPLLLTGKLTFAEVYWKTQRISSWMVGAVGDPLYTPYKSNPLIKPEELPPQLRPIFGIATTQPATKDAPAND